MHDDRPPEGGISYRVHYARILAGIQRSRVKGASAVWSRSRKARTAAAAEVSEQASARTGAHASADGRETPGGTPANASDSPSANGQERPPAVAGAPRRGSRRALKNWRVRSRLLMLIAI